MSTLIPSTSDDNILQKVRGVQNKIEEILDNPATTINAQNKASDPSDTNEDKPAKTDETSEDDDEIKEAINIFNKAVQKKKREIQKKQREQQNSSTQTKTEQQNSSQKKKKVPKTSEDDEEVKKAIQIFNKAVQKKKREIQKKQREQQNSSTQTKTEQQNSSQKKKKAPLLLTRAQIWKLKKKKEKEKEKKERQNSNNNDTNSRETKKSNDLFGDYEKHRNMSDEEMIRLFKQKMEKKKMLRTKRLQNKSTTQPNGNQIKTTLKRVDDSPNVVNHSALKHNSHTFNTIGHDTIGKQDMRHLMNERQNSNNNDTNSRVTKKSNHLFDDYNKRFNRSVEEVLQSFNQKLKTENMLRTKRLQNKSTTQPNGNQIKTTLKRVDDSPNVVNHSALQNNSYTFNTIGDGTIGNQEMKNIIKQRRRYISGGRSDGGRSDYDESDFDF